MPVKAIHGKRRRNSFLVWSFFPSLEFLYIDSIDLEKLVIESNHFPRLKHLVFFECYRLREIPDDIGDLPNWLFHKNQNLSKLEIFHCPKLRELPEDLHSLNFLEELTIDGCPNLKSMGNASRIGGQSQGTLRKLRIKKCEGLVDLAHEMVESWASSLEVVQLKSLSSLKNLPKVIECLSKSTRPTNMTIVGIPKFMAARRVGSWSCRSLRKLKIDASVEWSRENSVAVKETVDGILQGCSHSLLHLKLIGLEIWDCLPESIQNLAGVRWLELHNFGIKELPEWFGNLSSLKRLFLSRCKRLRDLGGGDALGSLTKLKNVDINDCPRFRIKWHATYKFRVRIR